jgi:hypothetical protein
MSIPSGNPGYPIWWILMAAEISRTYERIIQVKMGVPAAVQELTPNAWGLPFSQLW